MANKKHNDPLEEFFEKKLQDYDIQYREEDWLKLEGQLDAIDHSKKSFWKRYAVAAALVFLFSILAYVTYQQQQKINQLNERLTTNERVTNPENPPFNILVDDLFDFSTPGNESQSASDEGANDNQESDGFVDHFQNSTSDDAGTSENEGATSPRVQQTIGLADLSEPPPLITGSLLAYTSEIDVDREALNHSAKSLESVYNQRDFSSNKGISTNENRAPGGLNSQTELAPRSQSKFTVGIMGGPDISTVGGISNFHNPGYKLGLSVEYAISRNLSLSAGAIHSKVQYTARGNDYSPPEGYWSYGAVPDETIAQCLIIDIPISLKYNVLHFDHSRLYASGGVSSYIMLNEEYQFKYSGYNSSGQPDRWQERTGTRHWMSNAMVSVGFEQDISNNMSIRIEPFLKVPIQEVGWGNVKLYSMGSLFSVNYNLP
ncbi:hypothetical protein [Fodinibius sp. Rm-B-1B1-1]|uniref:hypothetical protein n=1 Tax=Fodinibius alkaliphilus TaxID=3140241 RepID=UPI00315AF8FF